MKKIANDCVDTDEFYAVRRTHFPNYWLATLSFYYPSKLKEARNGK